MNKTALNAPQGAGPVQPPISTPGGPETAPTATTRPILGQIRAIAVDNFQSIGHIRLELGNLTIIRGESRAGKSAFVRAVQAAVENRRGGDYVRAGSKTASVRIEADDCVIDWSHGGGANDYKVTAGGEVNEYKKVGTTVPDRVRDRINMSKMEFGSGVECNLNFSGQLDELFLVQGNPADNAKIIGAVSDLNSIYNGMREAERVVRELKRSIAASEDEVTAKTDEMGRLEAERDAKAKIGKALRELFDECHADEADAVAIKFIMDGLKDCKPEDLDAQIDRRKAVQLRIEGDIKCAKACNDELAIIESLLVELPQIEDSIRMIVSDLNVSHHNLETMEQSIAAQTVCQTCGAERKYWRAVK